MEYHSNVHSSVSDLLSFNSCVRAASCITRSWNIIGIHTRTQVQFEMKTSGIASKWALANQLNVSKWALTKWFKGTTSVNELSAGEVACHWYIVETRRNREENLNRWRGQILTFKSRLSSLLEENHNTSSSSDFMIRSFCSSFTDPNSKMYNRFKKKYQNAGQRHVSPLILYVVYEIHGSNTKTRKHSNTTGTSLCRSCEKKRNHVSNAKKCSCLELVEQESILRVE